jgi:16S rRNA (guanine966-N2)-methyltransferase
MRVIGGKFRSRLLLRPPKGVRATPDRVREALFSSLGPIEGDRVLDLCAGTGALGIEALSRGANSAVFVDGARPSITTIHSNLEGLGLLRRSVLREQRVLSFLQQRRETEPFDLVLFDPPYGSEDTAAVLETLVLEGWLRPGAKVVLETATRDTSPRVAGLSCRSEKHYGTTRITRFDFEPAVAGPDSGFEE